MKKFVLLVIAFVSFALTSLCQVINHDNCNCKTAIKRPVSKPIAPANCCPNIYIENNNEQPQPVDMKHYYPDPVDNSRWDVVAVLLFLILLGLLVYLLVRPPGAAAYYKQQAENHYNTPGINIHVHGSHACSDSSESIYNRESYYYKEDASGVIRKYPIVSPSDEIKQSL